ncbi:uncharacterized protein BXZ73DRAFT_55655 [Epithele typhae]|uniref:uncharacterized protein n=1 Tax=Epithele typhae TaxID=378194 RepID=UPI00200819D2|nr:uncharacterized protein BXZ73DRAFT_55655 [Epithele typhae]KAH9913088.1 hypothetical protein BXZ73DRAFT_55655 [Epithele typhae]
MQALAARAFFWFRKFFTTTRATHGSRNSLNAISSSHPYPEVLAAAGCAEGAIRFSVGHAIPHIVVRIADWIATFEARCTGTDMQTVRPFQQFTDMWRAYGTWKTRCAYIESQRLAKVQRTPNRYRCAVKECGIQAVTGTALRKCGGRCPPERKPHYCSWACQERHWAVHRFFCKSGPMDEHIPEDDDDPDWIDEEQFDNEFPYVHLPDRCVQSAWPDSEIFIDIPHPSRYRQGQVIRVRTWSLSPDLLGSYRALWTVPEWKRKLIRKVCCPLSNDHTEG